MKTAKPEPAVPPPPSPFRGFLEPQTILGLFAFGLALSALCFAASALNYMVVLDDNGEELRKQVAALGERLARLEARSEPMLASFEDLARAAKHFESLRQYPAPILVNNETTEEAIAVGAPVVNAQHVVLETPGESLNNESRVTE
jgi:hypothetical protein